MFGSKTVLRTRFAKAAWNGIKNIRKDREGFLGAKDAFSQGLREFASRKGYVEAIHAVFLPFRV